MMDVVWPGRVQTRSGPAVSVERPRHDSQPLPRTRPAMIYQTETARERGGIMMDKRYKEGPRCRDDGEEEEGIPLSIQILHLSFLPRHPDTLLSHRET